MPSNVTVSNFLMEIEIDFPNVVVLSSYLTRKDLLFQDARSIFLEV